MNDPVKLTVRIPKKTKEELEALSLFFNSSISELVRQAIINYIQNYNFLFCPNCGKIVGEIFFRGYLYYGKCSCGRIYPIDWMWR